MNQPMPVNPPELRSHLVEASKMPWRPTQFAGIEMKILYSDDEGRSTILFRMAPGAVVPVECVVHDSSFDAVQATMPAKNPPPVHWVILPAQLRPQRMRWESILMR